MGSQEVRESTDEDWDIGADGSPIHAPPLTEVWFGSPEWNRDGAAGLCLATRMVEAGPEFVVVAAQLLWIGESRSLVVAAVGAARAPDARLDGPTDEVEDVDGLWMRPAVMWKYCPVAVVDGLHPWKRAPMRKCSKSYADAGVVVAGDREELLG